ncbi:2-succinyl-5-enolpyruvyl-6-hydroxy-3-cyclohexene-1-carboxylate synthase [Gossypium arboreum]|uniref:2-succinyl-5-enolpyruvyl-6-hydroxy-3-cyclohexene-1-carboxylate synthase n=1 Tax=Gossypium arboreum TaxID=29729 RepID=A0A0B0NYP1_GOSAR|nr:2-succinyl-5-enolpyruvyl-6-hydroxy-3-cyclohexene-1-carboxylate synthase [Gossypium arboreum]
MPVPDRVLHEIKYDADVSNMVLHINLKSMPTSRRGLTRNHKSESYVMTYVS